MSSKTPQSFPSTSFPIRSSQLEPGIRCRPMADIGIVTWIAVATEESSKPASSRTVEADSHYMPCPCGDYAVPMPFPYHAVPLIHTCHATPLPCSTVSCPSWKSAWYPEISELLVQQFNRSPFFCSVLLPLFAVVGMDRCAEDWYASDNNLRGTPRDSRKYPNC